MKEQQPFITSVHQNSTLKIIGLGNNSIGDSGAAALAEALHHNSSLIKIDLALNSIRSSISITSPL